MCETAASTTTNIRAGLPDLLIKLFRHELAAAADLHSRRSCKPANVLNGHAKDVPIASGCGLRVRSSCARDAEEFEACDLDDMV